MRSRAFALAMSLVLLVGPVALAQETGPATDAAGEGVWRNYDFVPGTTVWRATDFAAEPVGRFPASQLEFVRGSLQIVELEGERVLEATERSIFRLHLPEALPETFSVEFIARIPTANLGTRVFFGGLEGTTSRHESDYVGVSAKPGIYRKGNDLSSIRAGIATESVPVRLQVDDEYAILYIGSERAAQVPNAAFARAPFLEFHMDANARFPNYVSDIVVAVGLDSLYDALMETGEFTTRGILFDSGSSTLRPESTPVLEQILVTLNEHAELRVVIEGHTDSVGDDAANQTLSEQRAAAVVRYLVNHGIEDGRLASAGRGESEPVADNETAEGRQQNRRVVIRLASDGTE